MHVKLRYISRLRCNITEGILDMKGNSYELIHTDLLLEQSSFMCINDFMGIINPREQNLHPAKCSMILNWLNIREQDPGANRILPRLY